MKKQTARLAIEVLVLLSGSQTVLANKIVLSIPANVQYPGFQISETGTIEIVETQNWLGMRGYSAQFRFQEFDERLRVFRERTIPFTNEVGSLMTREIGDRSARFLPSHGVTGILRRIDLILSGSASGDLKIDQFEGTFELRRQQLPLVNGVATPPTATIPFNSSLVDISTGPRNCVSLFEIAVLAK